MSSLRTSGVVLFAAAMGCAYAARGRFSFRDRTVVITGGSRGLGLVLARQFACEGAPVALLARREDELRRAEFDLRRRGAIVIGLRCDVRRSEDVEEAVERIAARFGRIDVLVNNAGIIQVGPLEHMTKRDFEDAMAVHVFGPLAACRAVLPHFRRAGEGRIVNIASIGGKVALPHLLPYTASKFALVGLSDGLRAELRRDNIYVTTVCPGLMRTGSPPNALFKGRHRREYAWFAIADSLPVLSMSAERAARKIIAACRRGSARVVLGFPAKAAALINELLPGTAARAASLTARLLPGTDAVQGQESHSGRESESAWAPSLFTRLSDDAAVRNNEQPAGP